MDKALIKEKTSSFLTGKVGLVGTHFLEAVTCYGVYWSSLQAMNFIEPHSAFLAYSVVPLGILWFNCKINATRLGGTLVKKIMQKTENKKEYILLFNAVANDDYESFTKHLAKANLTNNNTDVLKAVINKKDPRMLDDLLARALIAVPKYTTGLNFTRAREYEKEIAETIYTILEFNPHSSSFAEQKSQIDFLLPYYKSNTLTSSLLAKAVKGRHDMNLIKKIAHFEDPKKNKSEALRMASATKNMEVVGFLYHLSDPAKALKVMKKTTLEDNETLKLFISSSATAKLLKEAMVPVLEARTAYRAARKI